MSEGGDTPQQHQGDVAESADRLSPTRRRTLPEGVNAVDASELTWRELADALWLVVAAEYPGGAGAGTRGPALPEHHVGRKPDLPRSASGRGDERRAGSGGRGREGRRHHEGDTGPPGPVSVGFAKRSVALPVSSSLDVVRALRPLKRKVPDRRDGHVVLDEDATAERAVQDGLWLPVTTPDVVRWLDLTVVVDVGPAMGLWWSNVKAFMAQLEQVGAFRSIQVRLLDTRVPDRPTLHGGTLNTPSRSLAELMDHSGRRALLVVTDGISESWPRNQLSPMLARWGVTMPVAVVQLLPQRLWGRQGLAPRSVRLAVPAPMRPNRWWQVFPDSDHHGVDEHLVPVPVLELNPRWLGWFAQLITGNHGDPVSASVLFADPNARDVPAPFEAFDRATSAHDRIRTFVEGASPAARRLASLLAAVPVTLEIAQLVQQELVPGADTSHLVEVLVGGLLTVADGGAEPADWDSVTFDFHTGVRQELLRGVTRSDTVTALHLVADQFGGAIHQLERIRDALDGPDITPDPAPGKENRYYVDLEGALMRALSGPYLSRADRIRNAIEQNVQESVPAATAIVEDDDMARPGSHDEPGPLERGRGVGPLSAPPAATERATGLGHPPPELREQLTERERSVHVPPVWGDVPPRNPLFTGRGELLEQLNQRLDAGGTTAVLPSALHGMGGIGKTQMAVEYIYRHLDEYDIVWWIQAAQVSQVRKAFAELAQQLDLPGTSEVHLAVPAVREALRIGKPYRRWLLVFDAAEDIDDIREFFPTNGPGQILVTSRNPAWASVARPLEVAVFEREESVALLRKRGPEVTDDEANALADKLGDLPLAVEQAAAWRAETGMPVSEYLRLFDKKVAEILSTSAPTGYEMPVAAAWNVSFDALENRNPAAHQLLQVCAFFAPEPITRNIFTGGIRISISPDLDTALREPMQLGRAIRDINRYSLARIDHRNNTLQLHRLVQLVLRNRMSKQTRRDMRHGAHTLLANYDPKQPKSSEWWSRYQDIWPHIYSSDPFGCDEPWTRELVINMMQFLYFWGDHHEAAKLAQNALDRWTVAFGESDSQVLAAASYLGLYLWALGRYSEAADLNRRTLELRQREFGDNSEETIIAQLRVAVDIRTAGDFMTARMLNEEMYQKAKGLYGEDDPITLQTAHDLAVSVRLTGDYQTAFQLDSFTSARRGEVLGYDSVDTLNTLSGLYMDRRELGDYALARDEHEKILRRVKHLLGEDKADTLRRQAYLAVARRKAGDHDGALELSKEAMELFRRRYGDDHPNAMACAIAHSIDLRHAIQLEQSQALGERTFERYRARLGEGHPHTLAAAINLAVTLRLRGELETARQLNERSLEGLRTSLGPDHPYSIVCAIDLTSDLAALGAIEPAIVLGSEALERARRTLGENHPTTLAASLNLTLDLRTFGRTEEADDLYADTIDRFRRRLGSDHPTTIAAGQRQRANCDIDPLPT